VDDGPVYYAWMDTKDLLATIDAEIATLQQARNLLVGGKGKTLATSFTFGHKPRKKRILSAEAREKIAAAQRKRWAAQKAAKKK